jgi:hypothetical protein
MKYVPIHLQADLCWPYNLFVLDLSGGATRSVEMPVTSSFRTDPVCLVNCHLYTEEENTAGRQGLELAYADHAAKGPKSPSARCFRAGRS